MSKDDKPTADEPQVVDKKAGLFAYEPTSVAEEDEAAKKAREAYEAEQALRAENPNLVLVREPDPDIGGSSFDYGQPEKK